MKTIFYLPPGLPGGRGGALLKVLLLVVMTPIELIGKLAKPFALAVRLFANMTSGHVLVLALSPAADALSLDVGFRKPLFLPSTVTLSTAQADGGWDVAVRNATSGTEHVVATIRPPA